MTPERSPWMERADWIEACDLAGVCPDCGDDLHDCLCPEPDDDTEPDTMEVP